MLGRNSSRERRGAGAARVRGGRGIFRHGGQGRPLEETFGWAECWKEPGRAGKEHSNSHMKDRSSPKEEPRKQEGRNAEEAELTATDRSVKFKTQKAHCGPQWGVGPPCSGDAPGKMGVCPFLPSAAAFSIRQPEHLKLI